MAASIEHNISIEEIVLNHIFDYMCTIHIPVLVHILTCFTKLKGRWGHVYLHSKGPF